MSKKYYWLKLQKDFFKRHDVRIVEGMPNGKDYVLFYLKMLVESVTHDGELRFSETIPYDENMLATITNTNIDIVRSAIKIFTQLGLMDVWDDGTFYMQEIEKMTGCETKWAEKKRLQRKNALELVDNVGTERDNVRQEKEKEKEKEKEYSQQKFADDSQEVKLSMLLLNHILKRNSNFKKPNIQKWADYVDKMYRIDNRSFDEMKEVINWCQQDDFWQNNILSTKKLREQYDQLFIKMKKTKPKVMADF